MGGLEIIRKGPVGVTGACMEWAGEGELLEVRWAWCARGALCPPRPHHDHPGLLNGNAGKRPLNQANEWRPNHYSPPVPFSSPFQTERQRLSTPARNKL